MAASAAEHSGTALRYAENDEELNLETPQAAFLRSLWRWRSPQLLNMSGVPLN